MAAYRLSAPTAGSGSERRGTAREDDSGSSTFVRKSDRAEAAG